MYASTLLATQKSMAMKASRNFATTVVILAGSRSHDAAGARIMRKIKEQAQEEIEFIGIGGEEMRSEGLVKSYANVNTFLDKPLVPYKNFLHKHIMQVFHPVMFNLHKANRNVSKEMTKNNFWSEALAAKPKVYLTLGNEFFMRSIYRQLHDLYYDNDFLKPPMIHYDNLIINQRQEFQEWADYWLYAVPKEPLNWAGYKFPSTYVGSYSAGRAIEYLYRNNEKGQHLIEENTVSLSKDFNTEVTDSLLEDERRKFRQNNGLSEDATVFYTLPGNTEEEIKWAIPIIRGTVEVFLDRHSQYSSENFAVVVTSYGRYEQLIQNEIDKKKWPCKLIVAKTDEEKYSALAGSDMGVVANGEAVSECAAYHLPIVILNKLSFFQAYFTLLYNSFCNPLNIALNGEAYPECLGQAFPEKIAEYWGEWFDKPSRKFDIVRRFENLSIKLLPEVGERVEDTFETTAISNNKLYFDKFYLPEYLAAKKILEAADAYDKAEGTHPKRYELKSTRSGMLKAFY